MSTSEVSLGYVTLEGLHVVKGEMSNRQFDMSLKLGEKSDRESANVNT